MDRLMVVARLRHRMRKNAADGQELMMVELDELAIVLGDDPDTPDISATSDLTFVRPDANTVTHPCDLHLQMDEENTRPSVWGA